MKRIVGLLLALVMCVLCFQSIVENKVAASAENGVDSVYIVGNGSGNWLNGINMGLSAEENKMVEVSENIYEIQYDDLLESGDYYFMIVVNGDINNSLSPTYKSNISENGEYELDGVNTGCTIQTPADGASITFRVDFTDYDAASQTGATLYVVIASEASAEQYIVAGMSELCGSGWDGADLSNRMTYQGHGVFSLTYPSVAVGDGYQLKVVYNNFVYGTQNWIGDSTGNNIIFDITQVCDVTVSYDVYTSSITVSGDGVAYVTELDIKGIRVVGNGFDGWLNGAEWNPAADENLMTEISPKVYQIKYTNVEFYDGYYFKFAANGSWSDNWGDTDLDYNGVGDNRVSADGVFEGAYNGQNFNLIITSDFADVTFTLDLTEFDYSTKLGAKVTVDIEAVGGSVTPDIPADPSYEAFYAVGNGEGNWLNGVPWIPNDELNRMTETSEGVYEITFNDVAPGKDYQFKISADGSWDDTFSIPLTDIESGVVYNAVYKGIDNVTFDVEETTDVTIILDMSEYDYGLCEGAKITVKFGNNSLIIYGGEKGVDYIVEENTITVLTSTHLTISGKTTTQKIVVNPGVVANITLENLEIDLSNSEEPVGAFELYSSFEDNVDGAVANIELVGINTLKSSYLYAGLQAPQGTKLTISGTGTLHAQGGDAGAGIGGGNMCGAGDITINGGNIDAKGGAYASGIGGGDRGAGGTIVINGGFIEAQGGVSGAGVGGGQYGNGEYQNNASITINGGTVNATGGDNGAGIGGGYEGNGSNITIDGGEIVAVGGYGAAGIGGGANFGSEYGDGGTIVISGGYVTATGSNEAADIGNGSGGDAGTFSTGTNGNAFIVANTIADSFDTTAWNGVFFAGTEGKLYGTEVRLEGRGMVAVGTKLIIEEGQTLDIGESAVLYNEGEIVNNGTFSCGGRFSNLGVISGTYLHNHSFVKNIAEEKYMADEENKYYVSCECGQMSQIHTFTVEDKYVFFTNNKGWAGTVYIYMWEKSNIGETLDIVQEWPGAPMTLVGVDENGFDVYSYKVPTNINCIIFNGGGEEEQTVDIENFTSCTHYSLGDLVDENYTYKYNVEITAIHNPDENYICKDCGKNVITFESVNIALGSDISVNYYVNKYKDVVPQVKFTINDYTATVNAVDDGEQYKFVFYGVAPHWIGDTIVAELIVDGKVIEVKEYSVREYLMELRVISWLNTDYSWTKYNKMRKLVNDLLIYCGAAQEYMDYKLDDLVNEGIQGSRFTDLTETDAGTMNGSVVFTGANVIYNSSNRLMFKFSASDLKGISFKIKVNDGAETDISYEDNGDGSYIIISAPIYATGFDDIYTVIAYKDGVADAKIRYSVKSYVYAKQNETGDIATLVKAIYVYGASAQAFANAE